MVKIVHIRSHILKSIHVPISKLKVVPLYMLNELFIRFGRLETGVGPVHSGILWTWLSLGSRAVAYGRAEILVLYFFYFLKSFVLIRVCYLVVSGEIISIIESGVSNLEVGLAGGHSRTHSCHDRFTLRVVFVSKLRLRVANPGVVSQLKVGALIVYRVSHSLFCCCVETLLGETTLVSNCNVSHYSCYIFLFLI